MTIRSTTAISITDLAAITSLTAEAADAKEVFAAIEALADRVIGHKLFTIMALNTEKMQVRRLYSSNPDAYPVGGWKEKRDTEWGRQVLEEGRPYIGYSADDIRTVFDDSDLILSLELESVLNMPVRLFGQTIGTMNLLHRADYFQSSDVDTGALLAGHLVGALSR